MIARGVVLVVGLWLATASTCLAQPQKEPLPVAVVDIRGASVGLPITGGWTPAVPQGTLVPGRNYGLDVGGNVYLIRGRRVALGVGASLVVAQGKASPPKPAAGSTSTATPNPDVTTRLKSLAPQLSINFGHRFGWSYISGGLGRARVSSEVSRAATLLSPTTVDIGWSQTLNFGGGARWFINDHVGLNLDLRWHKLPALAATGTQPATEKASLIVAGGGITLK